MGYGIMIVCIVGGAVMGKKVGDRAKVVVSDTMSYYVKNAEGTVYAGDVSNEQALIDFQALKNKKKTFQFIIEARKIKDFLSQVNSNCKYNC